MSRSNTTRRTWTPTSDMRSGGLKLRARLSDELRTGKYRPQYIRRDYIPKPGSQEKHRLGIPTVRDRMVQTARRIGGRRGWSTNANTALTFSCSTAPQYADVMLVDEVIAEREALARGRCVG
jgi:hypothetical protein